MTLWSLRQATHDARIQLAGVSASYVLTRPPSENEPHLDPHKRANAAHVHGDGAAVTRSPHHASSLVLRAIFCALTECCQSSLCCLLGPSSSSPPRDGSVRRALARFLYEKQLLHTSSRETSAQGGTSSAVAKHKPHARQNRVLGRIVGLILAGNLEDGGDRASVLV